ncbi:DUF1566 domain-containing protein [Vibrio aestuarianus]|uniref:Lcl C-terminal domain-containing protein n=1 Tax=Vibrio aestuarianus TaxID=28171 RepID=UPI00237C74E6|nr:DUF1566 domain-containing protein [Vibrio aestuarianus]MDE1351611.1 DUF1566 domain-containing protein [Vibrio aestuarianus]
MKKLSLLTLSISAVLVGCGSDSDSDLGSKPNSGPGVSPPKAAVLYDIEVQPSQLNYLDHINLDQSFKVIGKYDDGTEADITNTAQWERVSGDEAVVEQGQVVSATGNTQFTVAYDSVVSDVVTLDAKSSVCGASFGGDLNSAIDDGELNADGTCLKLGVADGSTSKILLTSMPSESFLRELGYTESDGEGLSFTSVVETRGYVDTRFGVMNQLGSEGGQYARYCSDLAEKGFAGRYDWRRAEHFEIKSLMDENKIESLEWPIDGGGAGYLYIDTTNGGERLGTIDVTGVGRDAQASVASGASCVSTGSELNVQNTVDVNGLTFHRPLSESEVVAKGFTLDSTHTETGVNGPDGMVVSLFNWSNADALCENIEMGGHADWRLPTRDELVSLYNTTDSQGAFNAYGWPTVNLAWSSTSNGTGTHNGVNLHNGNVGSGDDSNNTYVSCVRGMHDTVKVGELTFHRPLSESEAVAKGFTPDLTFTETGSYGPDGMVVSRFNWSNADALCETVEMGGHADWRLPTWEELVSLYSTTDSQGAFNAYGWPSNVHAWSSTPFLGAGNYAGMHLSKGHVDSFNGSTVNYVSCVR